jgi:hypothetical protein
VVSAVFSGATTSCWARPTARTTKPARAATSTSAIPETSGDNNDIRIGSDTVGSGPGQQNRLIIPAATMTATVAELAREVAALQGSQR